MSDDDGVTYGPAFRWFAWHPVWTDDRGWRWLVTVTRKRAFTDRGGWWVQSVAGR